LRLAKLTSTLRLRSCSSPIGFRCFRIRLGPEQGGSRFPKKRVQVLFIQFDQHLPFAHQITGFDLDFFNNAVRLGFISTLATGSIRPIATTDRARSPFSTAASRDGSISAAGRDIRAT